MRANSARGLFFSGLPYMVLFTGMYVWFAFISDYILFYQEKSVLFLFSRDYLSEKLIQPGGFLYLFSAFLTSFYHYPAAGGMILSGVITLTAFVISKCMFSISGGNEKVYPFVTGLLLFMLHNDYSVFLMNSVGILLQALAFILFVRMAGKSKWWIVYILAPLLYLASGGFSWMFMINVSLYLIFLGKRQLLLRTVLLWTVMYLTFITGKNFVFFSSNAGLLFYPFELPQNSLSEMVFLVLAGLLAMLPVAAVARLHFTSFSMTYRSEIIIRTIAIFSVMLLIGLYSYDKKNVHYFEAEKMFYEGKSAQLTDYNTKIPSKNVLTSFLNNIALEEQGMLNDRLFEFLQSTDGRTLFLKWDMIGEVLKRGGYFYYTTGMINEAHRWAYENMVMKGYTPEGLKMLIKTELIRGNYEMASKFISLLSKSMFYRKDAVHFEKFLFSDEAVESDKELGEKRKIQLRTDFFSITDDPVVNIERVCMTDTLNRQAFDYMIACMLLKKDYKNLSASLSRYDMLGYSSFPRHVEEALLAITTMNNGENPYHGNIRISRATEERWTQFLTVFQQYGNNPRTAESALRRQFGNTFWYWAFYR